MYKGFKKGLFLELMGLSSFIVSFLVAFKLLDWSISFLHSQFPELNKSIPYVAFLLVFVGTLFLVNWISKKLADMIEKTLLGDLDNTAGAIVGGLKWAFLISLFIWFATLFGFEMGDELVGKSKFLPWIKSIAPAIFDFLAAYMPYIRHLLDTIQEIITKGK